MFEIIIMAIRNKGNERIDLKDSSNMFPDIFAFVHFANR